MLINALTNDNHSLRLLALPHLEMALQEVLARLVQTVEQTTQNAAFCHCLTPLHVDLQQPLAQLALAKSVKFPSLPKQHILCPILHPEWHHFINLTNILEN